MLAFWVKVRRACPWLRFVANTASVCPPTTSGKANTQVCRSASSSASKTLRPRTAASSACMPIWRWRSRPSRMCCPESCTADSQACGRGVDGAIASFVSGQSLPNHGLLAVGVLPTHSGLGSQGCACDRRLEHHHRQAATLGLLEVL